MNAERQTGAIPTDTVCRLHGRRRVVRYPIVVLDDAGARDGGFGLICEGCFENDPPRRLTAPPPGAPPLRAPALRMITVQ